MMQQTLQTLQLKRRGYLKGKANGFAGKSGTFHCKMPALHLGGSIWTDPAKSTSAVREVAAELQKLQQSRVSFRSDHRRSISFTGESSAISSDPDKSMQAKTFCIDIPLSALVVPVSEAGYK